MMLQERLLNRKLDRQAIEAADNLLTSLNNGVKQHRLRIGLTPSSMKTSEHMRTVALRTLEHLSKIGISGMLRYDPIASEGITIKERPGILLYGKPIGVEFYYDPQPTIVLEDTNIPTELPKSPNYPPSSL